jgi:flagellar hook-length control protein FliK
MGAKVSVTTTSASRATPTRAGEPAANPLTASNSFSSALGAASQPPHAAARAPAPDARSDDAHPSNTRADASPSTSAATDKSNSPATTNASATLIEDQIVAQQNKVQDKSGGKSRGGDGVTSATAPLDPTSLTQWLAGTGLQIDGSNSSGSQSGQANDPRGKSDADTAAQTAAAGAMAVSMTLASTLASSMGAPSTALPSSAKPSDGNAIASATSSGRAAGVADSPLIRFDSLSVGVVSSDAAAGTLQFPRIGTPDSQSDPSGALTAGSGLPDMTRSAASAPTQPAALERTVTVPVNDANWPGAIAGHVQWLVNNNVQSATLRLSPEHLGPVEVRIDVQQSQVNVSFSALHPDTRSALEHSVPRLREIFAGGGLTLGQATVQQEARSGSHFSPTASHIALMGPQNADSVSVSTTRALGLVDEYA